MHRVRLSELASAPPDRREEQIRALIQEAQNPDERQLELQQSTLDAQIRKFEGRYEMSSELMRQYLSRREMKETAEICSWLILLKTRDELANKPVETRTKSISELLRDS